MGESQAKYPWKDIPGSSHQVLLEKIGRRGNGLSVLDLGFGAGALAKRIRAACAFLAGIELDPLAARESIHLFDQPIVGDVVAGLSLLGKQAFDVIVAGDILEHLAEPEVALSLIRPLVKPDGCLLVSLPNVANVAIRAALLFGRFSYGERGILDRTHLRFFTAASGQELLERTGFRVVDRRSTAMPVELALPVLGRRPWGPPVRASTILAARLLPGLFGYQFVFEAVPA